MATNYTDKQSFGEAGAVIATSATGLVEGTFCAFQFAEDSAFSTLDWPELDSAGDDGTGVTFPAGFVLYAQAKSFTLASGSVVAYYGAQ